MVGFKRSTVIDRPIEQVFDFATDLSNAPRLMPGVTRTEMLTEGDMKAGARFRETRIVKGKERSAVIEVVDHQRPQLHKAASAMMGMKATYTFRFSPENAGTRVDMEAEVTGNLLWKLFSGMISRMMEREDGDYLTRLKDAMEKPQGA
jgi:carbon monoxide dehydrogenase subunit G